MKKIAEIMDELGFRPDSSDDVKKAFIKNLIKQANISEFKREEVQKEKKARGDKRSVDKYEQISLFDQKLSS